MSGKGNKQDKKVFPHKSIKLEHRKAQNFISAFASNISLAGPSSDSNYHLVFYVDAFDITYEKGTLIEDGNETIIYSSSLEQESFDHYREDQAKLLLRASSLIQLRDMLIQKFPVDLDKQGEQGG